MHQCSLGRFFPCEAMLLIFLFSLKFIWGARVVTLSPPTSEAGVWFPAWPQVGKLVVACRWLGVYSTEP